MYPETVLILISLREDIIRKMIKLLLDLEIEKVNIIHILDYYFDSKDYDISKISVLGFQKFVEDKKEILINEEYYQENPSDMMSRFNRDDFVFLKSNGYKTNNHIDIEKDKYLYDGIVRKYGIGYLLEK